MPHSNFHPELEISDDGSVIKIGGAMEKADGDTVSISLPMELRQEPLPGDDSVAAVLYGPLVLAADLGPGPADGPSKIIHSGDTVPKNLPAADQLPKAAAGIGPDKWVQTLSKPELRFKATGESAKYDLMPMFQIRDQRYAVYWQTENPKKSS